MAKVKKNGIEIVVDDMDLPKYIKAGWVRKVEVKPEVIRQRYEAKKEREREDK